MANYGYDYTGIQKFNAYGIDGVLKSVGYDVNGDVVYRRNPINLKLMEYNVGQWYIGDSNPVPTSKYDAYYALQYGIVSRANADVLAITEWRDQFGDSTATAWLSTIYQNIHSVGGTKLYNGRCICSKYPIKSYTQHYYVSQNGRGNYYDVAVITVDGVDIQFIVTHLEASDTTVKAEQATELFNFTQTLTGLIIICGDFNSILVNPMSEGNLNIYKNFLDAGYTLANGGAFGILPTSCNGTDWSQSFAIDNIICPPTVTINSVSTDLAKTTDDINDKIDHVPLIANVTIS